MTFKGVDPDNRIGKGFGRFLRQIVTDASR
jgi:hypothetical protein